MNTTSPSGGTSRGISVKDFEEQLTTLKKENFKLKLRIFFLEEKMGIHFDLNKENIVKKNIELSEKDQNLMQYQREIEDLKTQLSNGKAHSASLQISSEQAETLQAECDSLKREICKKNRKIESLQQQLQEANSNISAYEKRVKDLEQKVERLNNLYKGSNKKLQDKNKIIDNMLRQNEEISKKYEECKSELDNERKRVDQIKIKADLKVTQMEEENERQRNKTREVQQKLEVALMEVKKNQNLAVSKSQATPTGVTQTGSFRVPLKPQSSSSTPEVLDDGIIEKILQSNLPLHKIRLAEQIKVLKKQVTKLEAEQLNACKMMVNMIDSCNKHKTEKEELKRQVDELQSRNG